MDKIIKDTESGFVEALNYFRDRLKTVRTGRANPQIVEDIPVVYYGQKSPLKTLASISVPEPTTIAIAPFDRNSIDDIILALSNDKDLGLTPNSDGAVVRLQLPALSAERREQLIKQLRSMAEEARIATRNIREDAWRKLQSQEKDGSITEDDRDSGKKQLDELIKDYNQKIADALGVKEEDIRSN